MPFLSSLAARSMLAISLAVAMGAGAAPGQLATARGNVGDPQAASAPRIRCDHRPTRVILSPDGKTLVGALAHGGIAWDVATGKIVHRFQYLYGLGDSQLAFSTDGKYLGANGVWDMRTGKSLLNLPGMFSAFVDGDRVLMTSVLERSDTLLVGLSTGKTIRGFPGQFVGLARDARTVTTRISRPGEERTVVWDLTTGKQRRELTVPIQRCQHEGRLVLSRNASAVLLHDLAAGTEQALEWNLRSPFPEYHAAFSPDGKLLAAADDELLYVWETATGKLRHQVSLDAPVPPLVRILAYGRWIDVPRYPRAPAQIQFSPNGKWVGTAFHGDNALCLWDVATGKLLHKRAIGHTFAFSADGTTLVSGNGQSIRFWQTATGIEKGDSNR